MAKSGKFQGDEPDWVNPANIRKTPYTDEELDLLVDGFIEGMSDVQAWKDLVGDVGEKQARQVLKERFMAQDENNLVNWEPEGGAEN